MISPTPVPYGTYFCRATISPRALPCDAGLSGDLGARDPPKEFHIIFCRARFISTIIIPQSHGSRWFPLPKVNARARALAAAVYRAVFAFAVPTHAACLNSRYFVTKAPLGEMVLPAVARNSPR